MDIKMLIVQGRPQGKYLRFPPGEFIFGRGPECHVRPNSPWVSRQHCLLRVDKETVHVRDLGSSNGTLVNGKRLVGERRLQPGDKLQVGPLVLQLVVDALAQEDALAEVQVKDETNVLSADTTAHLPDL
jgi:pSer/pThr/pTyr-binding forkhead associated (FHA) protein